MWSPLHLFPKESVITILKVLVLSILYWMLLDPKMYACTGHVIFAKVIIYPSLICHNTSAWCFANLAYDRGLTRRLTSNLERCSGETIPFLLIHQGSTVDTTQILAILIFIMEMSYR